MLYDKHHHPSSTDDKIEMQSVKGFANVTVKAANRT